MSTLPEIRTESFALVSSAVDGVPRLKLSGNGDAEVVALLHAALKRWHDELVFAQARSTIVDVTELYFLNSSCLKAFVSWIYNVRQMSKGAYTIRLKLNPRQRWQRRGLEPLQRLAPAIVFLDDHVEGESEVGASGAQ